MKNMAKLGVLRIGHRPKRDKRITTHVGLVSRTFGADQFILAGNDIKVINTLNKVNSKWGNENFKAELTKSPKKFVSEWKKKGGKVVHLTMYGINLPDFKFNNIRKEDTLIIVGAEKVEPWYYENADYNVAIANQPHSEVSALAIFLDRYFKGKELYKEYDSKLKIIPMKSGKKVVEK